MQIEYTLTLKEYLDAKKLHNPKSKQFLYHLIFVGVLIFYLITTFDASSNDLMVASLVPALIAIVSYVVLLKVVLPRGEKEDFYNSPTLPKPISVAIEEYGLHIKTATLDAQFEWNNFTKWDKDEVLYNLYTSPNQYFTIPIRAMGKLFHAKLESMLTKHGVHRR